MTSKWSNYPFYLFPEAFNSILGGIIMLIFALSIGTWLGICVFENIFDDILFSPSGVFIAFTVFMAPICISCIQIWGLLYIAVLFCVVYTIIYEDNAHLRSCAFVIFPQFICTVIVSLTFDTYFDGWIIFRLITFGTFTLAVSATPIALNWIKRKNDNIPLLAERQTQ